MIHIVMGQKAASAVAILPSQSRLTNIQTRFTQVFFAAANIAMASVNFLP
jgi:hypothetical protein